MNIQIGERIRTAREVAGFTQERLAEAIDVSTQYISDLERGGSNEGGSFSKSVKYTQSNNRESTFTISCIPHFKLDAAYSDKRVHFSWGIEEIENHSIIVVHVGRHWTKKNERESSVAVWR